ncbi:FkbM family methyltransferase [Rhodoblastus acidophilus]|nr:FkbM family methyltransferase [Candidatus Rhodoblastus alkanivorans]MDI4639353.1 FkbM family methyltransferase [Rhodoblastus acidophilus]
MLARALRGVEKGFYVDVGAWDPIVDSVTAYFYNRGWRGVNIEPAPFYAQALARQRPGDVNLPVAIGAGSGETELFVMEGSGCSTSDPAIAELPALARFPKSRIRVETWTLTQVFERYAPAETHFLKVDCEGAETAVFAGFDLQRFRPWIIVVEATRPLSQIPSHQNWEPLLLGSAYHFAYFDGLNRFYVADEHSELDAALATPPNVWDEIELARHARAIAKLQARIAGLEAQLNAGARSRRNEQSEEGDKPGHEEG